MLLAAVGENPVPEIKRFGKVPSIDILLSLKVTVGVTVMPCVAEVSPGEAKVRVWVIPALPLMPASVKVAMPFTALIVVVPKVVVNPSVPLAFMVTRALLSATVLPNAS